MPNISTQMISLTVSKQLKSGYVMCTFYNIRWTVVSRSSNIKFHFLRSPADRIQSYSEYQFSDNLFSPLALSLRPTTQTHVPNISTQIIFYTVLKQLKSRYVMCTFYNIRWTVVSRSSNINFHVLRSPADRIQSYSEY